MAAPKTASPWCGPHGPLIRTPLARPSAQSSAAAKSFSATGAAPAEYLEAMDLVLERAHADLITWLAGVIVSLFNPERLQALPEIFAVFRRLSDPTLVARTLIVQLQCITGCQHACRHAHYGEWNLQACMARCAHPMPRLCGSAPCTCTCHSQWQAS